MSCRGHRGRPARRGRHRAIRAQYGRVVLSTRRVDRQTVLDLDSLDQPALRGLLTLLWDFGHDVVAVTNQRRSVCHDHQPAAAQVDVCIVGCGPAGAMLGLLLARAGVEVVVLEKHPDFHRDFRGDTIHASTLQVLDELGLMPAFDRLPHQPTRTVAMMTDDGMVTLGDFSRLPGNFQYLSMVPQWDFLTFLTARGRERTRPSR